MPICFIQKVRKTGVEVWVLDHLSPAEIRKKLEKYGKDKIEIFDRWKKLFEPELR